MDPASVPTLRIPQFFAGWLYSWLIYRLGQARLHPRIEMPNRSSGRPAGDLCTGCRTELWLHNHYTTIFPSPLIISKLELHMMQTFSCETIRWSVSNMCDRNACEVKACNTNGTSSNTNGTSTMSFRCSEIRQNWHNFGCPLWSTCKAKVHSTILSLSKENVKLFQLK